MIVSMWMTRELVTIEPDTPITEASALMARRRIRRLPVVERQSNLLRLVGIVTASDVFRAFPADVNPFAVSVRDQHLALGTTKEIMHRQPLTILPEAPIEEAAKVMRDQKIGGLLVVREKTLVGLITESDIFRAFVSLFESPQAGARITFDTSKGEDVFGLLGRVAPKWGARVISLVSSQQADRPVCVVRVTTEAVDNLVEDLWSSGHQVLNVIRFGG